MKACGTKNAATVLTLGDELQSLRETNKTLKDKLEASETQLEILKEEAERISSSKDSQNTHFDQKLKELNANILELEHKAVEDEEMYGMLLTEKDELLKEKADGEATSASLNAKNNALHSHYRDEMANLKAEIARTADQLTLLEKNKVEKDAQTEDLKDVIARLQVHNDQVTKSTRSMVVTIELMIMVLIHIISGCDLCTS